MAAKSVSLFLKIEIEGGLVQLDLICDLVHGDVIVSAGEEETLGFIKDLFLSLLFLPHPSFRNSHPYLYGWQSTTGLAGLAEWVPNYKINVFFTLHTILRYIMSIDVDYLYCAIRVVMLEL